MGKITELFNSKPSNSIDTIDLYNTKINDPSKIKEINTKTIQNSNSGIKPMSKEAVYENINQTLILNEVPLLKNNRGAMSAVLGSVKIEQQGFTPIIEGSVTKYSLTNNKNLRLIFPTAFGNKSDAEINKIKSNEVTFFNYVYGNDIKPNLGNTNIGDGYKYRGRGYSQLTGKANYREASKAIFNDDRLVSNPDLALNPKIAAKIYGWKLNTEIPTYAKKFGIKDLNTMSYAQASKLVSSIVAGTEVDINKGVGSKKYQAGMIYHLDSNFWKNKGLK